MKINKNKELSREDLASNFLSGVKNGSGAEIGSFRGDYAREILKIWGGTLYLIDVWRPLGEEYEDGLNHKSWENEEVTLDCIRNISEFDERAIMIRAYSNQAYKLFPDESLDFIYIDANHAYNYVKEDLELWYPKVKRGGMVMGHDYLDIDWYVDRSFAENGKDKHIWSGNENQYYYGLFGVNPAVDEFCERKGYKEINVTKEWFGTWYFEKK